MRVQLLANVADDLKGAILDIEDEDRAARLVRTGYAKAAATIPTRKARE